MKSSILCVHVMTTAAALTVWLGVVLKNVVHVDASFLLNHHHQRNSQHQRMMPSSSLLLFSKRTLSKTSSLTATTTSQQQKAQQQQQQKQTPCLEWTVYVDQSEASLEKGGSATLDAFLGLAPAATVQVKAALLPMGSYYASPNYGSSSSGGGGGNNNNNNNSVGPFVRCIPLRRGSNNMEGTDDTIDSRRAFDVCNVDSVDKVYRILTKHMRVQGVTTAASDCLQWKYKANGFLEAGQISMAIEAYDKALEIVAASKTTLQQQQQQQRDNNNSTTTSASSSTSSSSSLQHQEGALYLMRATAFLQRARRLRKELKATMLKFSNLVSSSSSTSSLSKSHQRVTSTLLKTVAKMAHVAGDPSLSNNNNNAQNNGQENPNEEEQEQTSSSLFSSFWGGGSKSASSSSSSSSSSSTAAAATVAAMQQSIFRRILRDAQSQEFQFRRTLYMHGLYQHALLQAAQDALYATELLPDYPSAWQQAGDVFSDLWKLQESTLFYQRAIQLDNEDDENDENVDSSSSRPQRRRLETTLKPVIERLKRRQQLLDQARSYYGWSEDTLRLALDVAATSMKVDLKRP